MPKAPQMGYNNLCRIEDLSFQLWPAAVAEQTHGTTRAMGRDWRVKLVKKIALTIVGLCALLYVGDYASVRIPIPKGRDTYSTVTVRPYYDVGLKSGKSEFYFLDPQKQTCVNSLFPHLGYKPCWYVRKHTHQRIAM
jgi:hypothetical protein